MMIRFLASRAIRALVVVFIVVTVTFILGQSVGDPARLAVGIEGSRDQYLQMREYFRLDDPLWQRLLSYYGGLLHGDFGVSTWQRTSALSLVLERLPATLTLSVVAVGLGMLVGVPLGFLGGLARGGVRRSVLTAIPMILVSLAEFWIGIMLILVFAVRLGWLPTSGSGGLDHLILPGVTLAMVPIGQTAALVSAAVQTELAKKYVVAARAKGLSETRVMRAHVLKNVAPTFLTVLGYQFVYIFTGAAVLVETVFQWPGVGKLALDALLHSDVILISAVVVVTGIVVAVINTSLDIAHAHIDRRVTLGASA